jgi:hypothetical protein
MKDILQFVGEHPFLTFLILPMLLGFATQVIPWAKRDRGGD